MAQQVNLLAIQACGSELKFPDPVKSVVGVDTGGSLGLAGYHPSSRIKECTGWFCVKVM